jgi:hypothetical protein
VIWSITCTSASTPRTIGAPLSPIAVKATPKKIEKTTIWRISLVAIASIADLGTRCVTNCLMLNSDAAATPLPFAEAAASWSAPNAPTPGWSRLTRMRPSESETMLAPRNQPIERTPMRPSAVVSPICAMPATSVANTRGAMIILISRRNRSVMIER